MKQAQMALMQFAKAPVPGKVKTRLIEALGAAQATELHKVLVTHSFNQLVDMDCVDLQLWVTDPLDAFFEMLISATSTPVFSQRGVDLGARMQFALETVLVDYPFACIIGSDCPGIDSQYVLNVFQQLKEGYKVVMAPAVDGGYGLVAVAQHCPNIFSDIDWGTDQVLAQTREHLSKLGCRWTELEPITDIDIPEDLVELEKYPNLAIFAKNNS